jgi:glycosyltransferase involved in cell wall biosynthesis
MKNKKIDYQKLPPIVCFAGSDWWYHNRGLFVAQIMTRLSKHTKVVHINSLGMRVPSLKQDKHAAKKIFRKLKSFLQFLRKDQESGMYIFSAISIPVQNKLGSKLNQMSIYYQVRFIMFLLLIKKPVFYVNNLPAWEIVKKISYSYLIYENTDLFSEMPDINKEYISSLNDLLIKNSDLVIYVNTALWKSGLKHNKNSILLGHGVDYDLFAESDDSEYVPEDISSIPKPIIGYYGDISDKTSDLFLLEHIVKELPGISLVLIGSISADISHLDKYSNVYILGQKPYIEIPHYGKMFDVAIMAWNKSKWIEHCNPVKMKEYLALGKPIVSTYYPEIEPYSGLVYVAKDYDEFIQNIKLALKEDDPALKEKRRKIVQDETWDSKIKKIIGHIESRPE